MTLSILMTMTCFPFFNGQQQEVITEVKVQDEVDQLQEFGFPPVQ
jgi:hypothetical protein